MSDQVTTTLPPAVSPRPAVSRTPDRRRLVLATILVAQLMVVLDMTIVNVALPHMQAALGFTPSGLSWVLNGYSLTFGGLLLLGARAGDLLGRRPTFIAGILLFVAASLAGGLAGSASMMIAARAVQGVGAAFAAPATLSLLTTMFPEGRERTRADAVDAADRRPLPRHIGQTARACRRVANWSRRAGALCEARRRRRRARCG